MRKKESKYLHEWDAISSVERNTPSQCKSCRGKCYIRSISIPCAECKGKGTVVYTMPVQPLSIKPEFGGPSSIRLSEGGDIMDSGLVYRG